ncbi:hypothetical protein ZOSMA_144G00040, partial [Zostera marina]
MTQD